ncbi:MAG: hypothetical protein H6Q84_2192, partial [Deltaproteobacteria bacterium]|nr:hypothetical protein [Deltaproteobacteria bacterium]
MYLFDFEGKVCAMKTTRMLTRNIADQKWYVV